MTRKARKDSISCFYHVMVQGIKKEAIFNKNKFMLAYKYIIKQKLKDSNINILAYCIMNNHAHFLIYSEKSAFLSKFMHRINSAYSNYYNKENERVGFVFRDRYLSEDITSLKQLFNCLVYIHRNPIAAGIVKDYEDYTFSSYNEFLGKKEIINNEGVKLLFGNEINYIEQFKYFHETYNDKKFLELKEKTKDITSLLKNIEKQYGKPIEDIVVHNEELRKIVKIVRSETDITLRELASILKISKTKLGDLC